MPDDARQEFVAPLGPAHALLIDHYTNMTAMQRRVCEAAVQEYRELQAENGKALVELARLTQKLMAMENPQILVPPDPPKRRPRPALRVRKR